MGNMMMIPGSHNASLSIPKDARMSGASNPLAEVICSTAGTALMFHQGVYHCGGPNEMEFDRYNMHIVFAPPWMATSDRLRNSPDFLARTTPLRRALLGEWTRPEQPMGAGYEKPPFGD
jgi:ectoine hydroxylase-related dioxygenase (phytanoyl-CoA dioxygenase family)